MYYVKTLPTISIESTAFSPKVVLDPVSRFFIIEGNSRPQDAAVFYEPVISWLKGYTMLLSSKSIYSHDNKIITLHLKLDYFNCASAKYIRDILFLLDNIAKEGYEIAVSWFHSEADTDMKESGQEFMKLLRYIDCKIVPFGVIEKPETDKQYFYN